MSTFIRFKCIAPLLFTFLKNDLGGLGADTVSIGLCEVNCGGDCASRSAEKHVRLTLVSTLDCHGVAERRKLKGQNGPLLLNRKRRGEGDDKWNTPVSQKEREIQTKEAWSQSMWGESNSRKETTKKIT